MSDRRTFLVQMGALTAVASVVTGAPRGESREAPMALMARRGGAVAVPVVGFLLDQPYLDLTGCATPYVPPAGLRSAQPLAASVDAAFHQGIWFQQDAS